MFSVLLDPFVKRIQQSSIRRAGSRTIAGLFFFLLLGSLTGCGLLLGGRLPQSPAGGQAAARIDGVPFFPQDELQCGPAALAMVLNWSGVAVQPAELTPEVFTPGRKGSLQSALIGAARRHGRVAYPLSGSEALLAEVAAGHPVIVLVNLAFAWYPKWHYAVVVGYDQEQGEVILHSGRTANEHLSARTFMNIWQRSDYWGLLVLPPARLPATVEEEPWLTAVAGLERVGQWQAATEGFAAALERWPESFTAWMGLGNGRYQQQDFVGAAAAFRQATLRQPENAAAFNNLAETLGRLGRREEALAAAQRAVTLGGPFAEQARQTLKEIEALPVH